MELSITKLRSAVEPKSAQEVDETTILVEELVHRINSDPQHQRRTLSFGSTEKIKHPIAITESRIDLCERDGERKTSRTGKFTCSGDCFRPLTVEDRHAC